ncbi:MAG: DUF2384 domain-containing protein [Phenylobacterium sp.]|uniref:antitoxin Xre/MbcA/ParS toxin-binding domain-containing protein n=1 Tax=Phenylobacterium sp. TaxID=1871053 RepID=UPI00273349F8|nr:antitoxin Xre/MbcA/ParS toxin-binding domain-containing protein [Phenylobacterium sp.]MDP3746717.1 DUF2384 domain-containing protein [Phenylobacterium sp.]
MDHVKSRVAARAAAAPARGGTKKATSGGHLLHIGLWRATPVERIELAKKGLGAAEAKHLIGALSLPSDDALAALRLPRATFNRKVATNQALSTAESERVIGMAKLVGQVEAMVEEMGDPTGFNASAWLSRWLKEPLPALGAVRPMDLMDTMEGQALVSSLLAQAGSGAYA